MNKRTLALGLLFMIGAVVQVGAHHEIRWVPGRWCGAHPPYTGTLWIGSTYGLPFNWIEVGRYEKCTTATSLIPDARIYPAGLVANLATYGVLVYFINLKREIKP